MKRLALTSVAFVDIYLLVSLNILMVYAKGWPEVLDNSREDPGSGTMVNANHIVEVARVKELPRAQTIGEELDNYDLIIGINKLTESELGDRGEDGFSKKRLNVGSHFRPSQEISGSFDSSGEFGVREQYSRYEGRWTEDGYRPFSGEKRFEAAKTRVGVKRNRGGQDPEESSYRDQREDVRGHRQKTAWKWKGERKAEERDESVSQVNRKRQDHVQRYRQESVESQRPGERLRPGERHRPGERQRLSSPDRHRQESFERQRLESIERQNYNRNRVQSHQLNRGGERREEWADLGPQEWDDLPRPNSPPLLERFPHSRPIPVSHSDFQDLESYPPLPGYWTPPLEPTGLRDHWKPPIEEPPKPQREPGLLDNLIQFGSSFLRPRPPVQQLEDTEPSYEFINNNLDSPDYGSYVINTETHVPTSDDYDDFNIDYTDENSTKINYPEYDFKDVIVSLRNNESRVITLKKFLSAASGLSDRAGSDPVFMLWTMPVAIFAAMGAFYAISAIAVLIYKYGLLSSGSDNGMAVALVPVFISFLVPAILATVFLVGRGSISGEINLSRLARGDFKYGLGPQFDGVDFATNLGVGTSALIGIGWLVSITL